MAQQRGVRGWVRNLVDGTVQVHAEGELEALADLERLLKLGPPASHVTTVEVSDAVDTGLEGFSVEPTR